MNDKQYLTVTALNQYIGFRITQDPHLRKVYIQGEISNLRLSNNIYYFSLKDENSEISCIAFPSYIRNFKTKLESGLKVRIEGEVKTYMPRGTYSLHVYQVEEDGLGQLYLNFLKLKEQLAKEGLFADKYKKPLPTFPQNIAIITSPTGDALNDIVSTINKRFPLVQVYLYPALVQGANAPRDLIRAIRRVNLDNIADVIIFGRGGGSFEDLACFNDELLAREVFKSEIPIVSAIGHENDYTICDFVSDYRAPTPTGAAVAVTPHRQDLSTSIINSVNRLNNTIKNKINAKIHELNRLINSYGLKNFKSILNITVEKFMKLKQKLTFNSPINQIKHNLEKVHNYQIRLNNLNLDQRINILIEEITSKTNDLFKYTNNKLTKETDIISSHIDKLILLNPLNVLNKGYTLAYQNDKIIKSMTHLDTDKNLNLRFSDGLVETKIITMKEERIDE